MKFRLVVEADGDVLGHPAQHRVAAVVEQAGEHQALEMPDGSRSVGMPWRNLTNLLGVGTPWSPCRSAISFWAHQGS
jgi:hypothetical protein